ncbi:MAG TPA: hypothetical protein VKE93_04785 [Candidatus Angelobacter sp.]|nr:hypothetical protein [Candidatus Angelobacter sp.]
MSVSRLMERAGLCVKATLIMCVVYLGVASLRAQTSDPATTLTCPANGSPSSGARGDGNDLQCRITTLLNKHQNLLQALQGKLANCGSDPHCNQILDHINKASSANARAQKANGRTTGKDGTSDYSNLNNIRKAKCTGKNSDCASGNGTITGGDSDPTVGQDLADQLDDAADGLDKATTALSSTSTPSQAQLAPGAVSATFVNLYDYTTDKDYPSGLHLGNPDPKATIGAKFAALLAAQVVEATRDAMQDACLQDLVVLGTGGNSSVGCIPLMIIARALDATHEILEFIDNDTTAWEVHGAYLRADNLNKNLGVVDGDIGTVQAAVGNAQTTLNNLTAAVAQLQSQLTTVQNELDTRINKVQGEIDQRLIVSRTDENQLLQLLLVPDGQRSIPASLLSCTGDGSTSMPCPPIAISCSATTGQCSFNK